VAVFEIALDRAFDFLSEEYRSLFESAQATPFQHPLWLDRLYRGLAPSLGGEPLIVTVRNDRTGRLEMVLPLIRRRHKGLRLVEFADLQVSDYACAVSTEAAFTALAEDSRTSRRLHELLRPYDLIRIKKAPDGTPPLERLFRSARRRSMDLRAYSVPLSDSFTAWQAAAMPGPYVSQLRRKRRKLERMGAVAYELVRAPAQIEEALSRIRAWRGARFAGDVLQDERYFAFYREIATAGADSGFSRTYALTLDGEIIAAVWGLQDRGAFLLLISGFDQERYASRSVGALAVEDLAKARMAERDQRLDFTIGDEPYKQLFGARPSPLWAITAAGTPLGVVADALASRRPSSMRLAARARSSPIQDREAEDVAPS
jgi:CelD/BcsL family acetyltransferase involved in cellulose biosynthesis